MSKKVVTLIGLALGPSLVLLLDVIFTRTAQGEAFEGLFSVVRGTAVFAWPVGVLLGHWYYPGTLSPVLPRPQSYIVLIASSLVVMAGSVALLALPGASNWVSAVALLLGMLAGALLWSTGGPPALRAAVPRGASRRSDSR
jgi:hypothetical protein